MTTVASDTSGGKGNGLASVTFNAVAGQAYRIAVDGLPGLGTTQSGRIVLNAGFVATGGPAPTPVAITALTSGATVSGTKTVTATATGATSVQFFLDGEFQFAATAAPFSWNWITTQTPNGLHAVSAQAYNGADLIGTSPAVTVTVANSAAPTDADANEPNNSSTQATALAFSSSAQGRISSPSDVDWFKIVVSVPGTLTFNLTVPAGQDYDLELYGGANPVYIKGSYGDTGVAESISHNATTTGTYYVRVYGYPVGNGSFSTTAAYSLTVNVTSAPQEPNWVLKSPVNVPIPRYGHAMAYDAARGQVVLFGGSDGHSFSNDKTWVWDGTNWTQKSPANSPTARYNHAMAYDVARGQVVLFGGADGLGLSGLQNDTWVWDGTNWSRKSPLNSPPARYYHALAYDADRGQVVLFGGLDELSGKPNDTWVWDGTDWTQKNPANSPTGRYYHAMAYDAARGQVVLSGGEPFTAVSVETWVWNGTNWTQKNPLNSPPARLGPAMVYDAVRGQVVRFCGNYFYSDTNETWLWDGTNWTQKNPLNSPPGRVSSAMAYDAAHEQVVLFGGSAGGPLNDTWVFSAAAQGPIIVTPPADQAVNVGQNAIFTVMATGTPPPTYQWRKGGTNIAGATNATFTIANVQFGDSGSYDVVVTNSVGSVISNVVTLAVTSPPSIIWTGAVSTDWNAIGNWNLNRVPIAGDTVSIPSGKVANYTGGPTGQIIVTGTLNWTGGSLSAALTIASGAVLNISGDAQKDINYDNGGSLTNFGTVNWSGTGSITMYQTSINNDYVMVSNEAGGLFNLLSDALVSTNITYTRGAFSNAGTLRKSGSNGTSTIRAVFLNSGTVEVQSGTLSISGTFNNTGTVSISAGAQMSVNGSVLLPSSITSVNNATFTATQAGTFTITATGLPAPTFSVSTGALPSWASLNPTTGVLTGTPPSTTGSPFTFTITAANGVAPNATSNSATLTVNAPPTITTHPASKLAAVETGTTLSVVAAGSGTLSYQWKKGTTTLSDDTRITGSTTATLSIANLALTDTGSYTVTVTIVGGATPSNPATLTVVDAKPTQAVVGSGYFAGGTVTITQTLTYAGTCTGLGWQMMLPTGWTYASGGGTEGDIKPGVGTTSLLEWAWTTVPASPVTFTTTLNVPAGNTGDKTITALAIFRVAAGPLNVLAKPDPLTVTQVTTHSADVDKNFRLSLLELTRVIELYNARNGSSRTGCYKVDAAGEDGFNPDPRARAAPWSRSRNITPPTQITTAS